MSVVLQLPFPPSINHCFSYYQGRPVLTKAARDFRHKVRRIVIDNRIKPILSPIAMRIDIYTPDDRRRDCDNVLKSILDALQHAGVFWDDSQVVWLLTVKSPPTKAGSVIATIASSDPIQIASLLDSTPQSIAANKKESFDAQKS
jgi:crossover junction endodeoxyribonuclease RusA